MTATNRDSLEQTLEELVRRAERLLDRPYEKEWFAVAQEEVWEGRCELVERNEYVTVVLEAPGYGPSDLRASVFEDEIKVETPDFSLRRSLPCRVDPESLRTDYRNGVLSVRIAKS